MFVKTLFSIALQSLWNRKIPALLSILSISLSVVLLLGIERIRQSARSSFESTVSGVDLIVGARSGSVNLLLYSVFRIGNATNNISNRTYNDLIENEHVEWMIPISLGDSHKGYKVIGTSNGYIQHYRYAGDKTLTLESDGTWIKDLYDVVLGAKVAQTLSYKVGDQIILSHGADAVSFQDHEDHPFTVKGILKPTGTPVDSSLHISLKAMTALHKDWQEGAPSAEDHMHALTDADVEEADITAAFVKLTSKMQIFNFQRHINDYKAEPLMAILPGVSLSELWQTLGWAEQVLIFISFLVLLVSLLSMLIALLSTLNERRREMAILRASGASKKFIFTLLVAESILLVILGSVLGIGFLYAGLGISKGILESQLGLSLNLFKPTVIEGWYLLAIFGCALVASLFPAWRAYRNSLADGLTIKV
ncbi:MAG: ABC transporter permease [Bdellovibrionaceae bacterium]|nr:ABC transporter permease [Pseudobdellovibrionaceae bacterium]